MNNNNQDQKLWTGVIEENQSNDLLDLFNNSLKFDYKLWHYDIQCSQAHANMLAKQQIITQEDNQQIQSGLQTIYKEIQNNPEQWLQNNIQYEDIHSAIEFNLTNLIGDAGKRLHTGRSRNDQVATDLRLYTRDQINILIKLLQELLAVFDDLIARDKEIIIPGYTHLQQAQPVTLAHHWHAHYQRFNRDLDRFQNSLQRVNICPLGAGALAGTTFNIDRDMTAKELGFDKPTKNSLDSVSDRDFVAECIFNNSLVMTHLSQLSEELIIWASQEFQFIKLHPNYATGSSMMPQKRNPDIPELLRAKTGRVNGNLINILTVLKALPMAYNKDLQEDKECLFDTIEHTVLSLQISLKFLPSISINQQRLNEVVNNSYMPATDIADWLVSKKNLTFRDAYKVVGQIVYYCLEHKYNLQDIKLNKYQEFCPDITEDIYTILDPVNCVKQRNSYGGTGNI